MLGVGLLCLIAAALFALAAYRASRRSALPAGALLYTDTESKPGELLVSHRYGLKGKPDALIRNAKGEILPVERKSKRAPRQPFEGDVLQAAAYCLLVEEAYGQTPPSMRIQYADRYFDIPFTPALRKQVLTIAGQIRSSRGVSMHRSHQNPARCRGCTQRIHCNERL
jgi:CRISPR-associated exonuclease Cas4